MASNRRHRKAGALTREQVEERFTAPEGMNTLEDVLAAVVAGGRDDDHKDTADEREADK